MRMLISLTLILSSAQAFAARQVIALDANAFTAATANPAQMDPAKLYYTQKVIPFGEWSQKFPQEAKALNLYQGFVEPTVTKLKFGVEEKIVEKMMMFVVEAKMVLNKAPAQVAVGNLIKIDSIRKFDPDLKQSPLAPNQLMPMVAGKGQINNFQWCSKDSILRPAREKDLSYLMPKGRAPWCSDTGRTTCVESCFLFGKGYNVAISALNQVADDSEQKDYGIAFQSEIRNFSSEQEAGIPTPLQKLTGVATAVRGGLEQNSFYFNQIFEYAKILGIMQDHPADPSKTLATVYFVVGVKERTWKTHDQVSVILLGQSKYFNTSTGITAGLPTFTQTTLNSIGQILEN